MADASPRPAAEVVDLPVAEARARFGGWLSEHRADLEQFRKPQTVSAWAILGTVRCRSGTASAVTSIALSERGISPR
jgi:hypothetical protein